MSKSKHRYRNVRYQKKPESESQSRWRKGIRDGFDSTGGVVCKGCFHLKNENAALKDEIQNLKQKLKYREKSSEPNSTGGAHTPSSRQEHKPNTPEESHQKRGGAKPGHKGYGRSSSSTENADEVKTLEAPSACPDCSCQLNAKDVRERTIIESVPIVAKRVVYRCKRGVCPKCFKVYPARPPALAKSLYGNSLIAQAAVMHFVHGVPIGKLLTIFGDNVTFGGLVECFHRLAKMAQPVREVLLKEYRGSAVKHADETGWRNDGRSGWAWLFATTQLSIFEFKDNRSARVPNDIFGQARLPGVLVVDRYGAYNKQPVQLQYCFAHLLREVEKLGEEFKDNAEVQDFCSRLATHLSTAMKLRKQKLTEKEYSERAEQLKTAIEAMTEEPQRHLGVCRLQELFIDKRERLYHWTKSRDIPAENNFAERELRPLVVARKVSFGSQSDCGAKTRSVIMTTLFTAKKRLKDQSLEEWLKQALDKIAENSSIDFASLIPALPSTPSN